MKTDVVAAWMFPWDMEKLRDLRAHACRMGGSVRICMHGKVKERHRNKEKIKNKKKGVTLVTFGCQWVNKND